MVPKLIKDAFVRWHSGYYGDGRNARDMTCNAELIGRMRAEGMGDIVDTWDIALRAFAAGYRAGKRSQLGKEGKL